VRREEGLPILFEVLLISGQHTIKPGKELLGAVIGVEDDGNAVVGGDGADVKGEGDGSGGAGVLVFDGLSGHELGASVGNLDHDRGVEFGSGFHGGVGGGRTGAVEGGDGIAVILGVLQELGNIVASDNTNGDVAGSDHFGRRIG